MKYITTIALALGFSATVALAGEATLEGKVQCAKCTLKKQGKCQAALVAKGKDGKEQVLLLLGKEAKALHKAVCKPGSSVAAKITGAVKEGTLKISKVEKKK
ncbi:MAG: hypothetical protein CMO74_03695 [Verrucomicrobiales bacterium]|nr:hypothetical protein [Verrucomicrobiales bacterium]|tara:strand:- start:50283 stop:50588 length:306 start_codon:yes stop_codon:yes gene_type:complete